MFVSDSAGTTALGAVRGGISRRPSHRCRETHHMTAWAWDEELDARTVLEVILGGSSEPVDPGGGSRQLHDFTLRMPSGRTVAVEVTRFADSRALQQRAEVAKRAHLRYPALRHDWQVKIAGTYDVDEWLAAVAPVLVRLEHDGLEALLVHRHLEDDEHSAEADLRSRRVRLVYRLGDAGPDGAQIFLAEASVGGSTSPDVVVDVGSMLAAKATTSASSRPQLRTRSTSSSGSTATSIRPSRRSARTRFRPATRTSRLGSTCYGSLLPTTSPTFGHSVPAMAGKTTAPCACQRPTEPEHVRYAPKTVPSDTNGANAERSRPGSPNAG